MIRLFDILFSMLAILLLFPLLLVIAGILSLTGEKEVFFRQERVGLGGRRFALLKFATMLKDSPNIGTGVLTVKDDPRILPFGRLLRKTKLNELPQLLNVLQGDMSLIGPRPQAPPHFEVFDPDVRAILQGVRPGLSGIGSIVFRDEELILEKAADKEWFYAHVIAPHKGEIETWYINHRSIGMYFALIFLTVWVILFTDSKLPRKVFPSLPSVPDELREL